MAEPILHVLPGDSDDSPERDHHYAFAHNTVQRTFEEDPDFSITATLFMDEGWLRFLWFEDTEPKIASTPGDVGLKYEVLTINPLGVQVALFTLPKPWFTTGAYFVAATVSRGYEAGQKDEFRVFTLERAVSDSAEESAIIGSWNDKGHSNHGFICEITRGNFLETIVQVMEPKCESFTESVDFYLNV